jgi:AraC-like DNA-binding protein
VRVVDVRAFLRRPADAMVAGRTWVYGTTGGLYFSIVFGVVDEQDLASLLRLWRVERETGGHVSLCDAGGLVSVTPSAFEVLGAFLAEERAALASSVKRQALVRPSGMAGALVAGYYSVSPPPYPYALFAGRAEALAWLGHAPDALAAADAHAGGEPLLRSLRERLGKSATHAQAPSLEAVARALAVSARSLQRRLGAAGTSFSREIARARVERAMVLLQSTDEKLESVAARAGCGSLSSFSKMFAREVGVPPSVWRARTRPGRSD